MTRREESGILARIAIRSFRQILENGHRLSCWCGGCGRWATCNLAELVSTASATASFAS
jgi:hypothetical protein